MGVNANTNAIFPRRDLTAEEQRNLDLVREILDAVAVRDFDHIASLFPDDSLYQNMTDPDFPVSGEIRGREEMLRYFDIGHSMMQESNFMVLNYLVQDDTVLALINESITVLGTGKTYHDKKLICIFHMKPEGGIRLGFIFEEMSEGINHYHATKRKASDSGSGVNVSEF